MEANKRMGQCKSEFMALQDSLEILGGKWKLLIMHYLYQRTAEENTFKNMQRGILGISAKMLSKELKNLELNLMVKKNEPGLKTSTSSYSITAYGKKVMPVTDTLINWGLEHRAMIKENG